MTKPNNEVLVKMDNNVIDPAYLVCRTDVILKAVFSQMPNEDLMQVMLVCRQWKDLGELHGNVKR